MGVAMKPTTGIWHVTTASRSEYFLDLDAMTMWRLAGEEANKLRKDGEVVPLIEVITLQPDVWHGARHRRTWRRGQYLHCAHNSSQSTLLEEAH